MVHQMVIAGNIPSTCTSGCDMGMGQVSYEFADHLLGDWISLSMIPACKFQGRLPRVLIHNITWWSSNERPMSQCNGWFIMVYQQMGFNNRMLVYYSWWFMFEWYHLMVHQHDHYLECFNWLTSP